MANRYLVLVDSRDKEKFRKFQIGQFNTATKKILDENNLKFIWGFHNSQISDIWKKIKKNDRVFFSVPKNNFEITSCVAKKLVDKKLGRLFWPHNLDSKEITHFLLFNSLEHIDLLFIQTMSYSTKKVTMFFPGLYELKKNFKTYLDKSGKKTTNGHSIPKPFVMPRIKHKSVQKETFEVMRFIRDTTIVKKLKTLYKNKCQICGYTFEYKKNQFYCEVHHYNPLKAQADDDIDNMIVVCPNHHAAFDYNFIAISRDGKSVIDRQGNTIAMIHFHKSHKLNIKNIDSQLEI